MTKYRIGVEGYRGPGGLDGEDLKTSLRVIREIEPGSVEERGKLTEFLTSDISLHEAKAIITLLRNFVGVEKVGATPGINMYDD